MFTIVAWDMARAGAQAALLALTGLPDQHVTVTGNDVLVPASTPNLAGVHFMHGTQAAAGSVALGQMVSPALRRVMNNDVNRAWDTNGIPNERQLQLFPYDPLPLDVGEALEAWMANTAVALSRGVAMALLCDGPAKPVSGQIRTVRFTTVTAAVADAWTLGVLTPLQQLPIGRYSVVGARCVSLAQAGYFRLVFTDYWQRPGGVITRVITEPDFEFQRDGWMGEWGQFTPPYFPRIEIEGIAAVANPDIYLDLIKTT